MGLLGATITTVGVWSSRQSRVAPLASAADQNPDRIG